MRLGAGLVHRSAISFERTRLCPGCLAEDGFLHLGWGLKPITACPRHGGRVIDRCPSCRQPLLWRREELCRCPCGQDLCTIDTVAADAASIALSEALLRKVGDWPHGALPRADIPESFAAMNLSDLVEHVLFLGAYASGRGRGAGRHFTWRIGGDALDEIYRRVATILTDWPNGFFALLDEIRRHGGEPMTRTGLEAEFRTFYAALCGRQARASGDLGQIRLAFKEYLQRHWRGGFIGPKNKRLGDADTGGRRHVTLAEAARMLDMHPATLEREIGVGAVQALTRLMGRRRLTLISCDELEHYRLERDHLIGLSDARRLLGLSKGPFLDLVRAGLVKAARGPGLYGSTRWLFRRPEVFQFLDGLLRGLPGRRPGADHLRYSQALRSATARGLGAADLISAILSGRLKAVGADPRSVGVERLYFDAEGFRAFLAEGRALVDWAVSVDEAAKRLGLKSQVAYHLVRVGLLRSAPMTENGRSWRMVPIDALPDFLATYVPATELAVRCRTSSRHVVAVLEERGVSAVTGPTIDSGRQYFFSRARLDKGDAQAAIAALKSTPTAGYPREA